MHLTDHPSRSRLAFTAVEMVGVLFLAGLLASLTVISLAGVRQATGADDIVAHVAACDALARQTAMLRHVPTSLLFNQETGQVTLSTMRKTSLSPNAPTHERNLYAFPTAYRLTRLVLLRADEPLGSLQVPISSAGLSPSYAIQFTGPGQTFWVLAAGLSGQVSRVNDEQEINGILERLAPQGNDAR